MTANPGKPLCIVPARGGSRRFPRKNIAPLAGKPLIAWTVEAAVASGVFERVWVSSEDEEILRAGAEAGGVALPRDAALAGDHVTVAEVCSAALRGFRAENATYDAVYVLLPTSPLRPAESIRAAWDVFCSCDADALISIARLENPPEWALDVKDGWVWPIDAKGYDTPRPLLGPKYRADGGHTIVRAAHLLASGRLIAPRTVSFVAPAEEAVDIDEPNDLAWAEFLLSRRG